MLLYVVSVFGTGTPVIYIDNRKVSDMEDLKKIQSNEIRSIQTDLHMGVAYGCDVRAVYFTRRRKGI